MRRLVGVALVLAGCVQDQGTKPLEAASAASLEFVDPSATPVLAPQNLPQLRLGQQAAVGVERFDLSSPVLDRPVPPALSAIPDLEVFPPAASSVSAVRQIVVAFELVGAGAPSSASVEFINPSGAPYERQELSIEGSAFQTHRLEFVLPVAATAIDTSGMSGKWAARLAVDGQPVSIQTFELTR
jgi:hypothetical protein